MYLLLAATVMVMTRLLSFDTALWRVAGAATFVTLAGIVATVRWSAR
jgi:hypothetical protein